MNNDQLSQQSKRIARRGFEVYFFAMIWTAVLTGSPATFVTALPVAQDQLLVRFNVQLNKGTQQFIGAQFPINIGYGLTSKWAIVLNLNQGFGSLMGSGSQASNTLSSAGAGDTTLFARYTLFKIDKPRSTFRIAPVTGGFLPTGNNSISNQHGFLPGVLQTGSGTVDPYFGITMGYNTAKWGMAADTTYRYNPLTSQGISPGSEFRADAQVEYSLYPRHLPEGGLPKELVLSVEANYFDDGSAHVIGIVSPASAGKVFRQDLFLEWTTLHWQLGVGAQVPVMQDLEGSGRMEQRVAEYIFFEYYLAAPRWRRHKVNT